MSGHAEKRWIKIDSTPMHTAAHGCDKLPVCAEANCRNVSAEELPPSASSVQLKAKILSAREGRKHMASIINDPGGRRRIQFTAPDGTRKTIRLGKVSKRAAEVVKLRVELLLGARITSSAPDEDTSRWLASIDPSLADKLATAGLNPNLHRAEDASLGPFLASYIGGRVNLKPNTRRNYEQTRKLLVGHFGFDMPLSEISPGDADEWGEYLRLTQSAATVGREVKRARQFFRAAFRKRLIAENPFADVATPSQANPERQFFVSPEVAKRVIDACPDAQGRLIFALSRYGGLRCPSEHLSLRWSDIDGNRGRMTVRSPKTEHQAGGASRIVPLFSEMRPYLEEARNLTGPDPEFVVTRYRDQTANLRTQLLRIIRRAGLEPWPKPFHNLRASRQTELTAKFPLHVVCTWLGNSAPIADKHYLQVTEGHYAEAAAGGANSGALEAQNAARQASATTRSESRTAGPLPPETSNIPDKTLVLASSHESWLDDAVYKMIPPRGVEPLFPP